MAFGSTVVKAPASKNIAELAILANIKVPNMRHNGASVGLKLTVKENNSVVSKFVNMKEDTQLIKNGAATNIGKDAKTGDKLYSLANGRVYVEKMEDSCTLIQVQVCIV